MDILLVEDNSSDAYLIKELFTRTTHGPRIHWVVDGHHALDYIYQRRQYEGVKRPDIILLDLNLPRINGYEVLKELKSNPPFAGIPIVILTTSRNPLDHTQCAALGADMCLSKPHAIKEYEELVRRLVSWATPRMPAPRKNSMH